MAIKRPIDSLGRFAARPLMDRFAEMVDVSGICWEWRGAVSRGYGRISVGQLNDRPDLRPVHRVMWELLVGPIPDGFELDHLCLNKICINPDHLEVVTHQENVRRSHNAAGVNSRKTECVNGHPLVGDNIYVPPKRPDRRYCRTCHNQRSREAVRSRKEVVS